jgi:hypothetical protein
MDNTVNNKQQLFLSWTSTVVPSVNPDGINTLQENKKSESFQY